ncbi:MAG: two-component regulator propeller domain-containing protein [Chitinophagales bacterium]
MRFFILFVFTICSIMLPAQTAFSIYDTSNSEIPDQLINVIHIDQNKTKWIGTQNGLVKIDSLNNWTLFNKDNSGLPDNDIRAIFYDMSDTTLWIGTFTKGLVKYHDTWTTYDPDNSMIPDYHVRAINKDINDTMWIGTLGGLAKWDGDTFWMTYNPDNSNLHSPNITDILIDENDIKFLGTINGGLSTYDHGTINYYRTENSGIGDNTVLSIAEDDAGNKWLATSFGGLNIYTPAGEFLKFNPLTSDITDWSVNDVTLDKNDVGILAMSSTGVNIFDNVNWEIFNKDNSELPEDFLTSVAIDDENRIWIGTGNSGLVVFDRSLLDAVIDEKAIRFSVFPNPTSKYLIVSGEVSGSQLEIYNLNGEQIRFQIITANATILNINDLQTGNYFIRITSEKTTCTKHLIVIN